MKTRLFIGNLARAVTRDELKDKFEQLLSTHKNEAEVGDVEIRCKNENNYFGFVDVHLKNGVDQGEPGPNQQVPLFLRKYIDLMNNSTWKGSLIKVQPAKESFLERLRREQEEQAPPPNGDDQSEKGRNSLYANDILFKLNRSKERNRYNDMKKEKDFQSSSANCGFEIVSSDMRESPKKPKLSPKKGKRFSKAYSSSDESDDDVRDGIPKFKGLLSYYPNGPQPVVSPASTETKARPSPEKEPSPTVEETGIQQKLLSIAFDSDKRVTRSSERRRENQETRLLPPSLTAPSSGIKFKESKQKKSDLLRLHSLDKLKQLKTEKSNIIKSSLRSVTALPPSSENRKELNDDDDQVGKKGEKRSGMTLFDEDSDEEMTDAAFNVKKQFEGESGQHLLELQTRWGNDDRFKVDNRFKDSDNEEDVVETVEHEKEKQLDILTGILGKVVTSKPSGKKGKGAPSETFSSVILPRYDPEADDNLIEKSLKEKDKSASKSKRKEAEAEEEKEKPIRSTEPATFKTVSNLRSLFSSGGDEQKSSAKKSEQSTFSLLATYGKANEIEEEADLSPRKKSGTSEPRTFWQSNPFKYDSSDDEDDVKKSKVKVTINVEKKETEPSLLIHGKTAFFFTKNDSRFDGLEDFFLKDEGASESKEGGESEAKPVEDFSIKRQELKAIVKAKIRNSKRKDEKRTLAIKRAIRKRKRKVHGMHKRVKMN